MNRGKTFYLLLLLLVTFFWGITFPIIWNALQYIGPVDFLALRFAVAAAIMVPFTIRRKVGNLKLTIRYSFWAGLLLFLGYYFQTVGLVYTTPAKSGIITGLYVVMLPLVSFTYLKMKVARMEILASAVAFAGLIVMSTGALGNTSVQIGDFMTLICAVAYTYQIAYVSRHSAEIDTVNFTFYQLLFVAIFSAISIPTFEPYVFTLNAFSVFAVVFTAIFASVFAIYVTNRALIFVEPTAAGVIYVGEPIFAALSSVILTGEVLSIYTIIGGAMMVFAMFMITLQKHLKEKNHSPVSEAPLEGKLP